MIDQIARRIIDRIKHEFTAFIDEAGNPDVQANQNGDLISDVRDHLGKLIAEDHQIRKQLSALKDELGGLQNKIEAAISSDREDLARAGFIRRNGLQRQIESLTARLQDIETESLELEALIRELSGDPDASGTQPASGNTSLEHQLEELEDLAQKMASKADHRGA